MARQAAGADGKSNAARIESVGASDQTRSRESNQDSIASVLTKRSSVARASASAFLRSALFSFTVE